MTTNEFERDLNDQSGLKRPGRIDLRVLQNTPDAGDGHPGVQRCFRNYLHEGGMEKDLQLIGYGIKGTSVDLTNAKLQEFNNIGGTTISAPQWVFVGEADQALKQADSPTFGGLTINGNITITGNVDSVDVGDLKTAFDNHKASSGVDHTYIDQSVVISASPQFAGLSLTGNLVLVANSITGTSVNINNAELQQLSNIGGATISGAQWGYLGAMNQGVTITSNVQFGQITMSGNIIMGSDDITFTAGGLVDGVDVSAHAHSGAGQGGTVDHVNLSNKGTNTHAQVDTHIGYDAAHFLQIYGTYTGNSNASKIVVVGGIDIKYIVIIKTSATQKTWVKIQGLSDGSYDAIDMSNGTIESDRIETDAVGLRVWGECNTDGQLYTYYGLRGT